MNKIGNKNKTYFEFSESIFSECLVDPPSLPYCSSSNPCSTKKGKKVFFSRIPSGNNFLCLKQKWKKKILLIYNFFPLFFMFPPRLIKIQVFLLSNSPFAFVKSLNEDLKFIYNLS